MASLERRSRHNTDTASVLIKRVTSLEKKLRLKPLPRRHTDHLSKQRGSSSNSTPPSTLGRAWPHASSQLKDPAKVSALLRDVESVRQGLLRQQQQLKHLHKNDVHLTASTKQPSAPKTVTTRHTISDSRMRKAASSPVKTVTTRHTVSDSRMLNATPSPVKKKKLSTRRRHFLSETRAQEEELKAVRALLESQRAEVAATQVQLTGLKGELASSGENFRRTIAESETRMRLELEQMRKRITADHDTRLNTFSTEAARVRTHLEDARRLEEGIRESIANLEVRRKSTSSRRRDSAVSSAVEAPASFAGAKKKGTKATKESQFLTQCADDYLKLADDHSRIDSETTTAPKPVFDPLTVREERRIVRGIVRPRSSQDRWP